jgi:DNA-binding CsgD family transcriptional regulator
VPNQKTLRGFQLERGHLRVPPRVNVQRLLGRHQQHSLRIEVRDDGTGPAAGWQPGGGVTSMRERAAELGGSCRFGPDPAAAEDPFAELTGREREVLELIAAGARNAEIARRMSIAPKTVANHISAIFTKLQIADRSEAIILARDAGLGRTGRNS